jgi:(2Fe-2S) ferredoxin
MDRRDVPYRKTIFVCTNQRAEGERICCAAGGSDAIRDALKALVKENGLKNKIRVCKSGCMDVCERGPNVMVFPDQAWLSGVSLEDVPEIFASVVDLLETPEE